MAKKKKDFLKDNYIKKLKEAKEAYDSRRDYYKNMSLKNTKSSGSGESASAGSSDYGGGVVLNGNMPTIDQYDGPDAYYEPLINSNYQTGLKAKLKGTDQWNDAILEQAGKAGVNPLFVKIVMATESGGKHSSTPNAYNCVGLMQVMGSLATGLGLDWAKVKSDPVYNIYAGCLALKNKHEYSKSIIKNNKNPYRSFKERGAELKSTCHGAAWLYNGFSMPSNGSSKVTTGGICYANQVAAMYKGFGRDAHKDTTLTLDVLEGNNVSGSSSSSSSDAGAATFSNRSSLEIEYHGRDLLSEDELLFLQSQKRKYIVPSGRFVEDSFRAPKYMRDTYVSDRKQSDAFTLKEGYAPLSHTEFIHMNGPQENYYAKEARKLFQVLKARLGYEQMVVVRGFEPDYSDNSSHSVGIAMDIYAPTAIEAIRIADAAFSIGIRSIAIGPKFVHVDAGPEATWNYNNLGVYRGPGTLRVGEIVHGFR